MQELDFITIGKRIRKRRKALHMTQEAVAYVNQLESDLSLDEVIVEKLRYCSQEKKETVSRIIDAL